MTIASSSAIRQIADAASSPVRSAFSPSKKENEECLSHVLPSFRAQLCSRVLWTYLVLGLVLLAVVFYIFATTKANWQEYVGVRPSGVPGFVDNPWFIYVVISIVGVLYVYGMYRAYLAAGKREATKYILNLVFFAVAALIVIWFYQFYRKGKLNAENDVTVNPQGQGYGNRTPFYIAISIIVLLVLQFYLFWQTGDRMAAYTVVPLVVVISLFAWASWELSLGATETFNL